MYDILINTPRHEIPFLEQTIINNIKTEINFGFIPNEYVIWGHMIYNREKSLFHHAVSTDDKMNQIIETKKIFGNDSYLPYNFNFDAYRILNNVSDWNNGQIEWHWLNHGRNQGWVYTLPDDFNYDAYRILNNVLDWNNSQIDWHWLNHGRHQGWEYKLPNDFNYDIYRKKNNVLGWNNGQIDWHWLNHGRYQGWEYK